MAPIMMEIGESQSSKCVCRKTLRLITEFYRLCRNYLLYCAASLTGEVSTKAKTVQGMNYYQLRNTSFDPTVETNDSLYD